MVTECLPGLPNLRWPSRSTGSLNAAEQAACRPWLAAELLRLKPQWIVALGAMAAQTVFGSGFRLTQDRGSWQPRGSAQAMATWHPAAILRMPGEGRQLAREQFFADLAQLGQRLRDG